MTEAPVGFRVSGWGARELCVGDVEDLYPFLKRDSSPGHPWVALGSTKGMIIDKYGGLLAQATLATLRLWSVSDVSTLPTDPVELVIKGYLSPLRVFVKDEPHNDAKLSEGRVRLIASMPVHIVLAQMILCGPQNRAEIEQWKGCPSCPGMGLAVDSDVKSVVESVLPLLLKGELAYADVSGFDWSVDETLMMFDTLRRISLAYNASPRYARALRCMAYVVLRAVFALSDGTLLAQLVAAIVKSGDYRTSSTNSFLRVLLAFAIGALLARTMGDDSVEQRVVDAAKKYLAMGIKLKSYQTSSEGFEFCSSWFTREGVAFPINPAKGLVTLLAHKQVDLMLRQQFRLEFRNSPVLAELERFVTHFLESENTSAKEGISDGHQATQSDREQAVAAA